jgi:tubulin polyglutamylase TTLL6/13
MAVNNSDTVNFKEKLRKAKVICNISDTEYDVVKQVASEIFLWKLTELEEDDWDITWTDSAVPTEKLTKMKPYQKINHFPGMHGICKKNYLAWNLNKMLKIYPNEYNFFPRTWVLPGDYSDFKIHANKKKVFIVKPEASSQGRGIFLIKRIEDINLSERFVVQEYLLNPYLIDGLKFDLRVYVLVTGCSPLRVFIHEDGLARLATEAYCQPNSENFDEVYMHLTNYAINKNNPKFIFNSDADNENCGHKRSLKSAYEYLESKGVDVQSLKKKIEDIILKTICSIQPSLTHIYKSCQPEDYTNSMCFELLGFDIIIDSDLNPLLLEVNHSPSFTTDTPLDYKIKQNLIKNTLQILGLKTRERKNYYKNKKIEVQKRAFSCKGNKETREERAEKIKVSQEKKEKWEAGHLGNFKIIYPAENKEKYDSYMNSASLLYSDISNHVSKKKIEELNKSNPIIKSVPKSKPVIPKKKPTLATMTLHKTSFSSAMQSEENSDTDYDFVKKFIETNKLTFNFLNKKDLVYYNQLNEILKDKKKSLSFLRDSEFHNAVIKLIKPVNKSKETGQGNFIVPKTFDFIPKVCRKPERNLSETKKHSKILNYSTF